MRNFSHLLSIRRYIMVESHVELIDTFEAVDDHGTFYTVHCFQEFIKTELLDGSISITKAGPPSLDIPEFGPVNSLDDNTFEIVRTKTIVKKIFE